MVGSEGGAARQAFFTFGSPFVCPTPVGVVSTQRQCMWSALPQWVWWAFGAGTCGAPSVMEHMGAAHTCRAYGPSAGVHRGVTSTRMLATCACEHMRAPQAGDAHT